MRREMRKARAWNGLKFGIALLFSLCLVFHSHAQSNLDIADSALARQDYPTAYRALRIAASSGYTQAQYKLGLMFLNGQGVQISNVLAYMWFTQAAANTNSFGPFAQSLNSTAANLARVMSSDEIREGQQLAQRCRVSNYEDCGSVQFLSEPTTSSSPPTATIQPNPSPPKPSTQAGAIAKKSTGSGFAISREGNIVTNAHVVDGCSRVGVQIGGRQLPATIKAVDERVDLAILNVASQFSVPLLVRTTPIALGEDATVFGYPLSGLLSPNLSLTRGVVSATSGLRGESTQYQISAPIQPGNSGGPIVDAGGNVIGVVVATLDALRAARITGSIPQNINFGIRSEALRLFLDANAIKYGTSSTSVNKSTAGVARTLSASIVLVECY